jgi:hypothetical protein
LVEPGPVTEDTELLSFSKAGQRARAALDQGATRVYFPLGLASGKVQAYRIIKPSAFIFQTPEQRAALVKQIQQFEEKNGTGLELLALRRSYRGRRRGSLCALADQLYSLIRAGRTKLEDLNANKMNAMLKELAQERVEEIEGKKLRAERGLFDRIDARNMNVDALPTGFLLTSDDVWVFEGDD